MGHFLVMQVVLALAMFRSTHQEAKLQVVVSQHQLAVERGPLLLGRILTPIIDRTNQNKSLKMMTPIRKTRNLGIKTGEKVIQT